MLDAVKYCLQKGCAMIDECFQKIDIRPEDFDEDDDPTFRPDPIYEPKVKVTIFFFIFVVYCFNCCEGSVRSSPIAICYWNEIV